VLAFIVPWQCSFRNRSRTTAKDFSAATLFLRFALPPCLLEHQARMQAGFHLCELQASRVFSHP
jgi:hypothetical protein